MRYTVETELEYPPSADRRRRSRLKIGRLLDYFLAPTAELRVGNELQRLEYARSPQARLNERELREITEYLTQVRDRDIRRQYFQSRSLAETFQGAAAPLVDALFGRDPEIRSLLTIGAYYAF